MSVDEQLSMFLMLGVVQAGDDANALVDNAMIARRLGWDLTMVAAVLQQAKDESLIWGRRSGEKPAPWYTDLEVTVQGRRLLRDFVDS
jgi:hypothetical protein